MIKRLLTSFFLSAIILLIIFSYNIWIFSVSILSICLLSFYEWIKNDFKNNYFGFLLIFNFGFWSIFMIFGWEVYFDNNLNSYPVLTAYFLYGFIIFNTAIFDIFAYIIGSNFGKTYIVKEISPNKTLEGLIGGLFPLILIGILMGLSLSPKNYWIILFFILAGFSSFVGDLLISYFKRQSGVKDTGTILPGHGGVLDRIDSHLITTPLLIIILFFII